MTDQPSDPLFQALHERLADYGQEPPAALWAGIRGQLPPPVAQPQLRRQRRRWWPAVLLGLLLAVVGTAGWHWWPLAAPRHRAGNAQETARRDGSNAASNAPAAAPTDLTPAAPASASPEPAASATASAVGKAATTSRPATQPGGQRAATQAATQATQAATVAAGTSSHFAASQNAAALARPSASAGRLGRRTRSARGAIAASATRAYPTRAAKRGRGFASLKDESTFRASRPLGPANAAQLGVKQAGLQSSVPPAPAGRMPTAAVAAAALAAEPTAAENAAPAAGRQATIAPDAAPVASSSYSPEPSQASHSISTSQLPLRVAGLLLGKTAPPRLRRSTDTLQLVRPLVRRWAVEVLAGPALTYQHNAAEGGYSPSATPTIAGVTTFYLAPSNEAIALGYGVQAQLRRVLTGRWCLSAGLGYQNLAVQSTYTTTTTKAGVMNTGPASPGNAPGPTTSTTVSYLHRDTYRFVTVPVRAAYALGNAGGPWRCALLAGADLAWYVGGNSAGPDNLPHLWSRAGSPYRLLNVALSAGLDVRCRLGPRVEALVQPSTRYFINSINQPKSGIPTRYFSGVGALLGVSYDLH